MWKIHYKLQQQTTICISILHLPQHFQGPSWPSCLVPLHEKLYSQSVRPTMQGKTGYGTPSPTCVRGNKYKVFFNILQFSPHLRYIYYAPCLFAIVHRMYVLQMWCPGSTTRRYCSHASQKCEGYVLWKRSKALVSISTISWWKVPGCSSKVFRYPLSSLTILYFFCSSQTPVRIFWLFLYGYLWPLYYCCGYILSLGTRIRTDAFGLQKKIKLSVTFFCTWCSLLVSLCFKSYEQLLISIFFSKIKIKIK